MVALAAHGCADPATTGSAGSGGSAGSAGSGGSGATGGGEPQAFDWGLPPGFPKPRVPDDNPMSNEKVELGRRLFYDTRLSGNQTQSCASCHVQKLAFTDELANAVGSTGEVHPRSSMGLANAGYLTALTRGNPLVSELEKQALLPMFGEDPVELGLAGKDSELIERLLAEPIYGELFGTAFPGEATPVALVNITRAIAAFERSILSYRTPYDAYLYGGDSKAMSEAALRGKDLFFSETMECFHCHGGFNLSDSVAHEDTTFEEVMFHNTGLYNLDGKGAYPPGNGGVYEVTGIAQDMGRFRAPSLRNVALTAPYMHDGSIATLSEVLDHYSAGGRTIASGGFAGDGSKNPFKSNLINGFQLTQEERDDVIAFLESLTDQALIDDPRFADPWEVTP